MAEDIHEDEKGEKKLCNLSKSC